MSATGHRLKYSGPTGTLTASGASYTAAYIVETNNVLDGPVTVWQYVLTNIATIGSAYVCGNDSDAASFLKEISIPQHEPGSQNYWSVTLSYEPKPPQDDNETPRNEDGDVVDDPRDEAADISIRYALESEVVEKAIYRGGMTHGKLADGDEVVPQNSALDPFDPPLEKDSPIQVIRVKTTVDNWNGDQADTYFNAVNSERIQFKAWTDCTQRYARRTLKINAIDAQQIWNSVDEDYDFEVTIELHYKKSGWRVEVVDRGHMTMLEAGDPDGRGGTVSPSDLPAGVLSKKIPVDHDGLSNIGPVLLNGAGKLLPLGDDNVYITYQLYEELNILGCPTLDEVFELVP